MSSLFRTKIESLLSKADVCVGGSRPWDIDVLDERFFKRVAVCGSLGLGESYMDGWWECERLDEAICRILKARLDKDVVGPGSLWQMIKAGLGNPQRLACAFTVGRRHYDLGNDLFERMLDKRMIYSCGYWRNARDLDAAQEAKLDLVCRKLGLAPGMDVLDIGCGWGGAARYAAEKYGVRVVGITVSEEQARYAEQVCAGLPVEIRLMDYRAVEGRFDRIFSIGMFEHVGCKNYRVYMEKVLHCLRPDGLFLLHTIGGSVTTFYLDPWMERYIFPNSMLPSAKQIAASVEGLFVIEDWENFGADYDRTLMSWYERFHRGWEDIKDAYGERFYRMWRYYLLACAGSFRARRNHVWQIVLSPCGVENGYRSIRY
ncbi:MAG: cyclopropane fatty acyl phospholipid synthase [Deltaproteobacteria bacterium]